MSKDQILTADDVMEQAGKYLSSDDTAFIRRAYEYAHSAHEGQFRKSGEAYIIHPVQVASILVHLELDPETVAGGFLHDVVEDTNVTIEKLETEFGHEVAMLVDGVTKLGKIKYKSKEAQQAANHRKMFVAMAKDIRVILIKLADRLHNMRTLKHLPPDKQRRISNETLEIFSPLAHRLGISTIKWELEDTALRYLNPQQYYRIVHLMKQKREEREFYIEDVMSEVQSQLKEVNIKAEMSGRPKHLYSIYRKMVLQNKQFNEIYDLLAVRIVVNSIKDCYAVLGIIHTCWKPMPGRFKDYIAMPKPNLYQSLHTTVIGPKGDPLEVQIRTHEMHQIAEFGIAAHWAYKEGKQLNNQKNSFEDKLTWFREILEWQNETHDAEEFMESLKVDLFSDMVYVFTPKGDVIELPSGSVPLDFAYRIHTEVGNHTIGAKINGKMEPLDYVLKTGDIVEVMTSKHSYGPSQDWIKLTQTSQAKNKIKQFFKKQRKDENVAKGRDLVEKEVKAADIDLKEVFTTENLKRVAEKFNFSNEEDMFAAVGYQGITAAQIATRLTEKIRKQNNEQHLEQTLEGIKTEKKPSPSYKKDSGVRVEGVDNLLVRLSKCCNPVPGDNITGYITKGRGVSVHRVDCPNVQTEEAKKRILQVDWENSVTQSKQYHVDLEISGYDRRGLLNEVLQAVNETKTNITAVNGKSDRNRMALIHITILIHNISHLRKIVDRIKQIKDVYTVTRMLQ
ncbi:bifunctional (p)ppGpp synthetase/guanosine-3',5'-bis(diphosphate) 3'-pyrophosphohydrolase [Aquibacillus sp. 3ASR75-11]|uniref:GTP pyrophosphokinase n=1 Tax=Terrihalobacillus insolitus TaxID=2950438 RepID=A0A9X4ALJ9_9BACI|nr:bifunctional (p)ppGpp synthetase/guanosine-3',5'-bis(diphosphate) 3'-pyrophosphohydrolase [Terrihalobacillus insolitus]MDC3412429.1 bifunctional (p)ppGpp synthetase/guanosine-3',5'-bis(diphosphate) 3'-pyrophosphohydrolase [Terrihalobacillus insolitus]MDC3423849.1 bifunctional (p)ppGpp synthetase/guanosine-3',5'-bis(diphosphate) 3'-pyrophosphohydrolase [Terrihalobacillus insolitus]